jgi:hypothetical protein
MQSFDRNILKAGNIGRESVFKIEKTDLLGKLIFVNFKMFDWQLLLESMATQTVEAAKPISLFLILTCFNKSRYKVKKMLYCMVFLTHYYIISICKSWNKIRYTSELHWSYLDFKSRCPIHLKMWS